MMAILWMEITIRHEVDKNFLLSQLKMRSKKGVRLIMFFRKTVRQLFERNNSKISDKWDSYLDSYGNELDLFRNKKINLLEIGVSLGGSLEVWGKFFHKATRIVGVDILNGVENYKFNDKRIKTYEIDVNDLAEVEWFQVYKPDIIIDDASHFSSDVINAFMKLFPFLNEHGVYIVEDLCCSYWDGFNQKSPMGSSMEFFKLIVDFVNYEHMSELQQNAVLNSLNIKFILDISPEAIDALKRIKSIKFYNSMCFIYKGDGFSDIGKRVVRGKINPIGNPKGRKSGTTPEEIVKRKDGRAIKELTSLKSKKSSSV